MLNFIAPHLTRSDLLDLYGYLNEFRRETEWLAQFESIFAADPAALPKLPSIQNYMANQHGADPLENMEQLQSELCRRFGVSPAFLVPHLMLGVSADVFLGSLPLNGLRHPPEDGTCGRFLWAGGQLSSAPDFFQPLHVEHLFERYPRVLPYLALPPGWRFLLADGYEDVCKMIRCLLYDRD